MGSGPASFGFAPKIELCKAVQRDATSPVPREKIYRFLIAPNHRYNSGHTTRQRGVSRSSRTWVGCGGRQRRRRAQGGCRAGVIRPVSHQGARGDQAARGTERRMWRTAKSCGPGTRCWCQVRGGFAGPTGPFRKTVNPRDDGDKRNSSPGRARRKPLKPSAQGRPDCLR